MSDTEKTSGNGLTERLQTLVSPEMQDEMGRWVKAGVHSSIAALVRAGIEAELARLRDAYAFLPAARVIFKEEMLRIMEKGFKIEPAMMKTMDYKVGAVIIKGKFVPNPNAGLIPESTYDEMEKSILERFAAELPDIKATVTFDRTANILENGGVIKSKVKFD